MCSRSGVRRHPASIRLRDIALRVVLLATGFVVSAFLYRLPEEDPGT